MSGRSPSVVRGRALASARLSPVSAGLRLAIRPACLGLLLALVLTGCTPPAPQPSDPTAGPTSPASTTTCSADPSKPDIGDVDGDRVADPVVVTYLRDPEFGQVLDVHNSRAPEQIVTEPDLGTTGSASIGDAVLVVDVTRDGCADVVTTGFGGIYLIPGSDAGLVPGRAKRLQRPANLQEEDNWGQTIAILAGPAVLAVGVPGAESPHHGGAVLLYPLAADGTPGEPTVIDQDTPGIPENGERNDYFGWSLAADGRVLAIGAIGEEVGGHEHAGAVTVLRFAGPALGFAALRLTRLGLGFPAAHDGFEEFGGVLAVRDNYLAVGVPSAVIGGVQAGMVHVFELTGDKTLWVRKVFSLHQNSPGIPGKNETNDHWGGAVAFAANVGCTPMSLVVGATGERFADKKTGSVTLVGIGRACGDQWNPSEGPFNAGFCRLFGARVSVLGTGAAPDAPDVVLVADPFARVDGKSETGYVTAVRTLGKGVWAAAAVAPSGGYRESANYGRVLGITRPG